MNGRSARFLLLVALLIVSIIPTNSISAKGPDDQEDTIIIVAPSEEAQSLPQPPFNTPAYGDIHIDKEKDCKKDVCPEHWSGYAHRHIVDRVTNYRYGGYTYFTGRSMRGPGMFKTSETYSWSNSWSASIGYEAQPINIALGINVEASGSIGFEYEFNLPDNYSYGLYYTDYYQFYNMDVHTEYIACAKTCHYWSEYGTATARVFHR